MAALVGFCGCTSPPETPVSATAKVDADADTDADTEPEPDSDSDSDSDTDTTSVHADSMDVGSTPSPTDTDSDSDSETVTDTSGQCTCKPGEVWLIGACVPTTKLGCGVGCKTGSSACKTTELCDPDAATPACNTSSLAPACVPGQAMGFDAGSLRLSPTTTTVGTKTTVTFRGGQFYIGALVWNAFARTTTWEKLTHTNQTTKCTLVREWTPKAAGVYPIVLGYGFDPPYIPHPLANMLAGFIAVDGPDPGIQPGFPCTATDKCAQADVFTCSCKSGRCACTTP